MKLIVCPTDFSATSTNAIHYACGIAQNFHALIVFVHVYEAPVMYSEMPLTSIQFAGDQLKILLRKNSRHL